MASLGRKVYRRSTSSRCVYSMQVSPVAVATCLKKIANLWLGSCLLEQPASTECMKLTHHDRDKRVRTALWRYGGFASIAV